MNRKIMRVFGFVLAVCMILSSFAMGEENTADVPEIAVVETAIPTECDSTEDAATEPISEPVTEKTAAEAAAEAPALEPVVEMPVAESAAEAPATEPAAEEPAAEPVPVEPMAEPAAEGPATEPAVEVHAVAPAAEGSAAEETAAEPAIEPVAKAHATEPVAEESAAEPVAEVPTMEPVAEGSVAEETAAEHIAEAPVSEPETEPVAEAPAVEPVAEAPVAEAAVPENGTEQSVEAALTEAAPEEEATAVLAVSEIREPEGKITTTVLGAESNQEDSVALAVSNYMNENSTRGFVYRLYKVVLNRTPDEAGFWNWVNHLNNGTMTAGEVVNGFFNSIEYTNSGKTNDQIVTDCYQTMLNRKPDSSGFQYWKKYLNIGMTAQSICAGFVNSPEFNQLCGKYGLVVGSITPTNARDLNYERTYFVYRLYQNCLERKPDLNGLEHWCNMLVNGMTGTQAAGGFFFSDEFWNKRLDNTDYVDTLYHTILGREADAAGRADWVSQLNFTHTREHVLNGFMNSPEFNGQCQQSGIVVGNPIDEPDNSTAWQYNIEVLKLCNENRAANGLSSLHTREDLWRDVAMVRAKEAGTLMDSEHLRPDGRAWSTAFKEEGFDDYYTIGENLASGHSSPNEVVNSTRGWMYSAGHRANILNKNFEYLATGYYYDPNISCHYVKRDSTTKAVTSSQYTRYQYYWAQSFYTQAWWLE